MGVSDFVLTIDESMQSLKNAYPIPDIQDVLDNLRGSTCFCSLDLLSGYWQLGMTPVQTKGQLSAPGVVFFNLPACLSASQGRLAHSVA